MTVINQIYESRLAEDVKTTSSIELHRKINQLVIATTALPEDKEELTDLFFEISNYGHEVGFEEGFILAIQLMAECF